ncbi:sensor histidine kinase [Microscilla marina]|uniref:Putative two-component system sensor protein n=1 Tax=Microscilla marina ATCC 23134 TaxID=313606 RepID=A1ZS46_MICM2|nr:histidine kinase [Microscilla marina]EAY26769.1 putative two-component system sensor protein [Microscilla marina ATCC 23134]
MKPQKIITIVLHGLFWLAISFFYYSFSSSRLTYTDKNSIFQDVHYTDLQFFIPLLIGNIFKAILFYGNSEVLMKTFLQQKRYFSYLVNFVGLVVMCYGIEIGVDYFLVQVVPPTMPQDAYPPNHFQGIVSLQPAFYLIFIITSFGARFTQDWVQHETEKQYLQQSKLQTELKFLKSQINPHFLFNTLNNLYASALSDGSERTAEGIAKLSKLIRYMLHESNVDRIALEREVAYIETYIELQKLRFAGKNNTVNINFEVEIDAPACLIAPMLLITFVENAFKHGISKQQTSSISIELKVSNQQLSFRVENTVNPFANNQLEEKSGLGLKNVQRQLELLYANKYTLEVVPDKEVFKVNLVLTL